MARPNKRAFGNAGSVKKIFKMTQTEGKKGCWGKAAVLLYAVSLEARSTTYCSNRLPASTALLGEPLHKTGAPTTRPQGWVARARVALSGDNGRKLPGSV